VTARPARLGVACVAVALLAAAGEGAARLTAGAPVAARLTPRAPADVELRVGFLQASGRYRVERLPLETYVARVVAGEAARESPPAALEALAITVRTYALANRGRHRADGFDLCDQTHCQVVRTATPETGRAAEATAGRVLLDRGEPASIYYTASCGGHTEVPSAVWPGAEDPSYLPSRKDEACQGLPAWSAELTLGQLQGALARAGFRGRLRDVRIRDRDASGRVARLRLDGLAPDAISGQDLRVAVGETLGWRLIKSTAFTLARRGRTYRFSGHGSGHGVGLCVIGSTRLAADGVSPAQILARYFPGLAIGAVAPQASRADLQVVPSQGVRVSLPDDDAGEREAVAALVARARDELARQLGVPVPPSVIVRFHPTTASYEQATGRAWFTGGAVVRGELHLPPPEVLRARGVLDRAIRQDLVRLLTGRALAGRPLWVREGAAVYFADPAAAPPTPATGTTSPFVRPPARPSCPADGELAQPVSIGALSTAWARARACFARELERTRDWREVGD